MKHKTGIITAIVISASLLTGLAYAQGNPMGPRGPAQLVENLDLSTVQQQNFDALMKKLKSRRMESRQQRQEQRKEMLALLDSSTLDQEKAVRLVEQKARAIEKSSREMIETIALFTDSLTTEQKKKLKENIQQRMEKMRQRLDQNGAMRRRAP